MDFISLAEAHSADTHTGFDWSGFANHLTTLPFHWMFAELSAYADDIYSARTWPVRPPSPPERETWREWGLPTAFWPFALVLAASVLLLACWAHKGRNTIWPGDGDNAHRRAPWPVARMLTFVTWMAPIARVAIALVAVGPEGAVASAASLTFLQVRGVGPLQVRKHVGATHATVQRDTAARLTSMHIWCSGTASMALMTWALRAGALSDTLSQIAAGLAIAVCPYDVLLAWGIRCVPSQAGSITTAMIVGAAQYYDESVRLAGTMVPRMYFGASTVVRRSPGATIGMTEEPPVPRYSTGTVYGASLWCTTALCANPLVAFAAGVSLAGIDANDSRLADVLRTVVDLAAGLAAGCLDPAAVTGSFLMLSENITIVSHADDRCEPCNTTPRLGLMTCMTDSSAGPAATTTAAAEILSGVLPMSPTTRSEDGLLSPAYSAATRGGRAMAAIAEVLPNFVVSRLTGIALQRGATNAAVRQAAVSHRGAPMLASIRQNSMDLAAESDARYVMQPQGYRILPDVSRPAAFTAGEAYQWVSAAPRWHGSWAGGIMRPRVSAATTCALEQLTNSFVLASTISSSYGCEMPRFNEAPLTRPPRIMSCATLAPAPLLGAWNSTHGTVGDQRSSGQYSRYLAAGTGHSNHWEVTPPGDCMKDLAELEAQLPGQAYLGAMEFTSALDKVCEMAVALCSPSNMNPLNGSRIMNPMPASELCLPVAFGAETVDLLMRVTMGMQDPFDTHQPGRGSLARSSASDGTLRKSLFYCPAFLQPLRIFICTGSSGNLSRDPTDGLTQLPGVWRQPPGTIIDHETLRWFVRTLVSHQGIGTAATFWAAGVNLVCCSDALDRAYCVPDFYRARLGMGLGESFSGMVGINPAAAHRLGAYNAVLAAWPPAADGPVRLAQFWGWSGLGSRMSALLKRVTIQVTDLGDKAAESLQSITERTRGRGPLAALAAVTAAIQTGTSGAAAFDISRDVGVRTAADPFAHLLLCLRGPTPIRALPDRAVRGLMMGLGGFLMPCVESPVELLLRPIKNMGVAWHSGIRIGGTVLEGNTIGGRLVYQATPYDAAAWTGPHIPLLYLRSIPLGTVSRPHREGDANYGAAANCHVAAMEILIATDLARCNIKAMLILAGLVSGYAGALSAFDFARVLPGAVEHLEHLL